MTIKWTVVERLEGCGDWLLISCSAVGEEHKVRSVPCFIAEGESVTMTSFKRSPQPPPLSSARWPSHSAELLVIQNFPKGEGHCFLGDLLFLKCSSFVSGSTSWRLEMNHLLSLPIPPYYSYLYFSFSLVLSTISVVVNLSTLVLFRKATLQNALRCDDPDLDDVVRQIVLEDGESRTQEMWTYQIQSL